MATDSSHTPELTPARSDQTASAETTVIDASLRTPVTVLVGSALVWLLIASLLGLIAAWKLHTPAFLDDCAYTTYGRVQPAAFNAFVFGWGFNAAFAVALWLMARLSRGPLPGSGVLLVGSVFWNLGVTLGVGGIIAGFSTSIEGLELPGFATPLLLVAYALVASWVVVVFRAGRSAQIYASQWYLFAALFWFPWLYAVAQVMLVFSPVRGTVQAVVQTWFNTNLFLLWFGSVALAAIYYFLPKLTLKPVANYYLASLAFWWLAIFGGWAGIARLIGGPVPAWVQTVGAAASFMLVVPAVIIGMNVFGTLSGRWPAVRDNVTLRFVAFGAFALLVLLVGWVFTATHAVASVTQFTLFSAAETQLGLYGVFTMVAFGALYYIVPRVFGTGWASAPLVGVHFAASLVGVLLLVGSLAVGGVSQGLALADPKIPFAAVTAGIQPYLFAATIALVVLAVGQIAFALNFFWTLSNASAECVRAAKSLLTSQTEAAR